MKKVIKKNIFFFIIVYVIILLTCIEFTKGFALIDHYNMSNKGYVKYAIEEFFKDGRIFSGVYILVANILNIKIQYLYIFSNLIGIIIVTLNVLYLNEILKKINNLNNEFVLLCISIITIFNWTCVNILHYVEFPIISASIFLYLYSAKKLIIDNKVKLSLITLIIALFAYQGTMSVFFSCIVFFSIIKSEITVSTTKKVLKGLIFGVIAISVNYFFINIYGNIMKITTRTQMSMDKLLFNLKNLWKSIAQIYIYSNLALHKYMLIFFLLVIIIIALLYIRKDKKIIVKIIFIFITNIIVCIPLIISFYANDIWISGRLLWSIGATVGMCLFILYNEIKDKYLKITIIAITIIYMIIALLGMRNLVHKYKMGNKIDKIIVDEIEELRIKVSKENKIDKIFLKSEFTRKWFTKKI